MQLAELMAPAAECQTARLQLDHLKLTSSRCHVMQSSVDASIKCCLALLSTVRKHDIILTQIPSEYALHHPPDVLE